MSRSGSQTVFPRRLHGVSASEPNIAMNSSTPSKQSSQRLLRFRARFGAGDDCEVPPLSRIRDDFALPPQKREMIGENRPERRGGARSSHF